MTGTAVENWATAEDRDFAWRHAFEYADSYATTEDAVRYANHYVGLIAREQDMAHWPSHGKTFADWRTPGDPPDIDLAALAAERWTPEEIMRREG